jgi:hypothetical protein
MCRFVHHVIALSCHVQNFELATRKSLTFDFSVSKTIGNSEEEKIHLGKIDLYGHPNWNSNSGLFLELRLSDLKITDVMI